jgi:hypothetical protein
MQMEGPPAGVKAGEEKEEKEEVPALHSIGVPPPMVAAAGGGEVPSGKHEVHSTTAAKVELEAQQASTSDSCGEGARGSTMLKRAEKRAKEKMPTPTGGCGGGPRSPCRAGVPLARVPLALGRGREGSTSRNGARRGAARGLRVGVGEGVVEGEELGGREAEGVRVREGLGVSVVVGVMERVIVGVELGVREAECEQLGFVAVPGEAHAEGQVQGVQFEEPGAEKVPAGQGVGIRVERGQKEPAGHRMGAPLEQE